MVHWVVMEGNYGEARATWEVVRAARPRSTLSYEMANLGGVVESSCDHAINNDSVVRWKIGVESLNGWLIYYNQCTGGARPGTSYCPYTRCLSLDPYTPEHD